MRISIPGKIFNLRVAPTGWGLPALTSCFAVAFSVLFVSCFSFAPSAVAQQAGAPATDVSNLPRPINDTFDRVQVRDLHEKAPAGEKKNETEDSCLLPPLTLLRSPVVAATALAVPPKAKKEYSEACAALKNKKTESAEKHLRMAVQEYPSYSVAWVTLGQMLAAENHTEDARNACAQGSAVEPKYVPAYLCLAEIAARAKAWGDVLQLSGRAIDLDPSTTAISYEYNAAANLRTNQLDAAEKSALRGLSIDKDNTDPRAHFLLAQIYEAKGDRTNEIAQLREYLKFAKDPDDVAAAKQFLSQVEESAINAGNPAGQKEQEIPDSHSELRADGHRKTEVTSESVPPADNLLPSTPAGDVLQPCRLDEVLPEVKSRVQEFVENVQRFTATESLVLESFSGSGQVARSERRQYDYVVSIEGSIPGMLQVNEFQNSRSSSEMSGREIVTKGLPALVLIFHPFYAGDFSMECEGLASLNGKPAWQVRFRQREDKPSRIRSYSVGSTGRAYQLNLKGRAWFMASNYQILRLETDLIKPIAEIQLAVDRVSAEYGPVHFRSRGIDIWLPQAADLVCERKGKRRHERITFSDYYLFAVDNKQELASPKARECNPSIDKRETAEIGACPNNFFGMPILRN
jgi:cytochrome c-type biogenesis protein CcmH/NrfG